MTHEQKVCAVVGVGPGNGAALARRFAAAGYRLALLARTTDFTDALIAELGVSARAYPCDAAHPVAVTEAFGRIAEELGPVDVLCYNAGSGMRGPVDTLDLGAFEAAWRVNALGLLAASQAVVPEMKAKGGGAIIITGATASRRGGAQTAAFAPAKAAQRSLAESMAKRLWPVGIHVALIIVDGAVNLPRTREMLPDKPDDFFIAPADFGETAYWLAHQPRSAWSFEVEARPFKEIW
jgi:NAD(P)-dependent dehydrogenase (short-subunit alcohol dehydrogenase family)